MSAIFHPPAGWGDPNLWVLVALLAFLGLLLALKVPAKLAAALDNHANTIRTELEDAKRLREEAQELLGEYQRRQNEAEAEAAAIIDQARREADMMAETARKDFADRLARRTAMAEAKIAQAEASMLNDVRARAAELAVAAAADILGETVKSAQHKDLIDAGIADIKARL